MNRDFIMGIIAGVIIGAFAGIAVAVLLKQLFNYDSSITEEAVKRLNVVVDELEAR